MENFENKIPVNIYVLYDTISDEGESEKIYKHIYGLLCRDSSMPLSDGIDIPVYLRTKIKDKGISKIDYENSEISIIIVLIDLYMYGDNDWEKYVKEIYDKSQNPDSNVYILPVSLCDYAVDFAGMRKINAIKYRDNDIFKHIYDFDIRLYDFILSALKKNEEEHFQIFISHAKKDGVEKADELKSYIAMNTKFHFFYDANVIKDGSDFEETIKNNAANSLLVILNSDAYSGRDWCQREVVIAKNNYCPIVLVDLIDEYADRAFPYLGNIPWVAYKNNNWENVLKILLRTAVNYAYQIKFLNYVASKRNYSNYKVLPFVPELFTVTNIKEKTILYPEPVLGYSEKNLLKSRFSDKVFITPSQLLNCNAPSMIGKRIAISVSESENSIEHGISTIMLRDLVVELARYIIVNGGHLVYGGNLQNDGYTKLFMELAKNYKNSRELIDTKNFFTNYFAWPIYLKINADDKAKFKDSRVETVFVEPKLENSIDFTKYLKPENDENKYIWSKSLSAMREEKEKNTDILILVGGKTRGFKGCIPGILEEFLMAIRLEHPVYLLGGFGGMAEIIAKVVSNELNAVEFTNCILEDKNYATFLQYYNKNTNERKIDCNEIFDEIKKHESLVNKGLSRVERNKLLRSNNIIESIELVFKGINGSYVPSV